MLQPMITVYRDFAPDPNSPPYNLKEVSSDEWWRWYGHYHHVAEWGGIWLLRNLPSELEHLRSKNLELLYHPERKEGIAYIKRVERSVEVTPTMFFKFAVCEHDFRRTGLGNCLHEDKCSKCGYSYTVDSSG